LDSLAFSEKDEEIKPSILEATPEQLGIHVLNKTKVESKIENVPVQKEQEKELLEEFPQRRLPHRRQTFTRLQESVPKKRKKKLSLREIVQQRKQQERWKRLKEFFTLLFTRFGEFVNQLMPLLISFFARVLQLNPFTRTHISSDNEDGVESFTIYQNHNPSRSLLMKSDQQK
jgi:hypothetical protein